MGAIPQEQTGTRSQLASADARLKELGIDLPAPPEPFGTYAEAVQTGNLLFLTGMLPTEGREAKFVGRLGRSSMWKRVVGSSPRGAQRSCCCEAHLGSLDQVTRVVRLGVSVATSGDVRRPAESGRRRF